jgi:hypothetical protein
MAGRASRQGGQTAEMTGRAGLAGNAALEVFSVALLARRDIRLRRCCMEGRQPIYGVLLRIRIEPALVIRGPASRCGQNSDQEQNNDPTSSHYR